MNWSAIKSAIKDWCLAPETKTAPAGEPKPVVPYWQRDPTIGEPVRAMMIAFEKCPARFKFKAEYRITMNTFQWRGTVTDSLTGEKFDYSGNTNAGGGYYGEVKWAPLGAFRWEYLLVETNKRISSPDVDVSWMTAKEKAFVREVVSRSLSDRSQKVKDYTIKKANAKRLKAQEARDRVVAMINQTERCRLMDIYKENV